MNRFGLCRYFDKLVNKLKAFKVSDMPDKSYSNIRNWLIRYLFQLSKIGPVFYTTLFITKGNIMKTNLKTLLIIGALTMPLTAFAADGDTVGTKVGDAVITTKVKAEFAKDKAVSATAIKVETDSNGLVQLSGTAKTQAEVDKAVVLAKNVKGVTAVKNDIVVTP